jgi:hypothetical protein
MWVWRQHDILRIFPSSRALSRSVSDSNAECNDGSNRGGRHETSQLAISSVVAVESYLFVCTLEAQLLIFHK